MPIKAPKRRVLSRSVFRGRPASEQEVLTGFVMGKPASDLEERFYRGIKKLPIQWVQFQKTYGAPYRSMYGAVTLDFLVKIGTLLPVQIDAEWIHRGAKAQAEDWLADQKINEALKREGAEQVVRIIGKYLSDQETADHTCVQLYGGRRRFDE